MAEHRVESSKDREDRPAPQSAELAPQAAESAPPVALPGILAAGGSDQQVAAQLHDPRLHRPQRQALARRVGQDQGNRTLQRILRRGAAARHTGPEPGWEMPLPAGAQMVTPGAVQRETSTPIPKGATVGKGGTATLKVGDTTVVIKPDVSSKAKSLKGKASTSFALEQGGQVKNFAQVKGGKVVSFKAMPAVKVVIQTTYGSGVSAETPSGYGKGTTEEDIKAGTTTLKHHEGTGHGSDYVQYVKDHPLPQFKGEVGMDVKDFQKAMQDYQKELEDYRQDMEKQSKEATDCVGIQADFCEEPAGGEEGAEEGTGEATEAGAEEGTEEATEAGAE